MHQKLTFNTKQTFSYAYVCFVNAIRTFYALNILDKKNRKCWSNKRYYNSLSVYFCMKNECWFYIIKLTRPSPYYKNLKLQWRNPKNEVLMLYLRSLASPNKTCGNLYKKFHVEQRNSSLRGPSRRLGWKCCTFSYFFLLAKIYP